MPISRVRRSKSAARRAYDRLSPIYDLLTSSSEAPLMRLGLELLAPTLGDVVLEIGPGTGKALVELSRLVGACGRVHTLDLSPGMLRKSQARLDHSGLSHQVNLLQADGASLPYRDTCFNAVTLSFTLELFDTPEIPFVLAECRRVLKPGGNLGIVSMYQSIPPGLPVRLYEWFRNQFPAYADCRPIPASDLVLSSGFSLVKRYIQSMWGLPVEILVARSPMG